MEKGDNESDADALTELDLSPKKNEKKGRSTKLRRTYAVADMEPALEAAESADGFEPQASNDEYEAENQVHDTDGEIFDDEQTPKQKKKANKVPLREEINFIRKEKHEPHKAEKKVGWSVFFTACW